MLRPVFASSVRRLVLFQLSADNTSMFTAPLPVVTLVSPLASMLARSVTFNTASAAVGEHTPPEQVMFCVGSDEITTSACAAPLDSSSAVVKIASFDVIVPSPMPSSPYKPSPWGNVAKFGLVVIASGIGG